MYESAYNVWNGNRLLNNKWYPLLIVKVQTLLHVWTSLKEIFKQDSWKLCSQFYVFWHILSNCSV